MPTLTIPPDVRARAEIIRRKKLQQFESDSGHRAQHQLKYWNNPADWARDCIQWYPGEFLTDYQADVMQALVEHKRVSARATHGGGKSTLAALIVLWFADTRDGKDWKIPTTASAWRQLEKYLWPEVHKWVRRIKWNVVGRMPYKEDKELLDKSLKLSTGEAFAVASDNPELIEGAHATHLLYVFDEAKAIPPDTWDAAEGAFATGECFIGSTFVNGLLPQAVSKRWYKGTIIEVETRGGHKVTVTPNHPVLTPSGWVKFGSLKLGDKIISCHDANSLMMRIKPDAEQVPSRIQDVFESMKVINSAVTTIPEMLSSKDFNSPVADFKVNIISTDSLLGNRFISTVREKIKNFLFINRANDSFSFTSNGRFNKFRIRSFLSKIVTTSFGRTFSSLFRVYSYICKLCLFDVSSFNSMFFKSASDSKSRNSNLLTELFNRDTRQVSVNNRLEIRRFPFQISSTNVSSRFYAINDKITGNCTGRDIQLVSEINSIAPGNIFVDEIINLQRTKFEGHVYNLQNATHWYIANYNSSGGILVHNCMWLSISTPGEPNGRFYDIQSRKAGYQDWWVRHITLEECIKAGRVSKEWAENRLNQWGVENPTYQNRVLGNFASSDEESLIPLSLVERAIERWHKRNDAGDWGIMTRLSVDVGRGGDPTVYARRHGWAIKNFEETNERTTAPIVGKVKGVLQANPSADAVIDIIGVGAGCYDVLREEKEFGRRVKAFVASLKTDHRDKTGEYGFSNLRSASWYNVKELLEENIIDLPDNELMVGDLTTPRWRILSGAKVQVESKGDWIEDGNPKKGVNARLGRSTNYGDTVIQAFMPESKPKVAGTFGRS